MLHVMLVVRAKTLPILSPNWGTIMCQTRSSHNGINGASEWIQTWAVPWIKHAFMPSPENDTGYGIHHLLYKQDSRLMEESVETRFLNDCKTAFNEELDGETHHLA